MASCCEVVWLVKLLKDLKISVKLHVELGCDSTTAILISANPVFHDRTKHFEIDLHTVRDKVVEGLIKVVQVGSFEQPADLFTKGLGVAQHHYLCEKLKLVDPCAN